MEQLSLATSEHGAWTVIAARGELDVATAPRLRQHLVEAQLHAAGVVVDLEGIELLDSFGLGVLVGALKRARAHGRGLAVRCTRPRILHVLELTGLTDVITVVGSVADLPPEGPPGAAAGGPPRSPAAIDVAP